MRFDRPGDIIGYGLRLLRVTRRQRSHEREGGLGSHGGDPTCRRRLRRQLSELVGETDGWYEVYTPQGRRHRLAENSFAGKLCGHDRGRLVDDTLPKVQVKGETEGACIGVDHNRKI